MKILAHVVSDQNIAYYDKEGILQVVSAYDPRVSWEFEENSINANNIPFDTFRKLNCYIEIED